MPSLTHTLVFEMDSTEEILRAIGEHLKELGYVVEAKRDFHNAPFLLEITKPGALPYRRRPPGKRRYRTALLVEIEDEPGKLELYHDDLADADVIDITNPHSFDEILQKIDKFLGTTEKEIPTDPGA